MDAPVSITRYGGGQKSRLIDCQQPGRPSGHPGADQFPYEDLHFDDVHDAHSPSPSLHIGSIDVQQDSPRVVRRHARGTVRQFPARFTCLCVIVNSNYGQTIFGGRVQPRRTSCNHPKLLICNHIAHLRNVLRPSTCSTAWHQWRTRSPKLSPPPRRATPRRRRALGSARFLAP